MSLVTIIHFSGSGHTTKLAEALAVGAASVEGVRSQVLSISGDDIDKGRYKNDAVLAQLDASDAIVFGSPTYMGGPAAQFKAFADATAGRWFNSSWRDKLAAGFTVSGSPSGDKLNTLHYFFTLAMQHGMIWAGVPETPYNAEGVNRLGSNSGAMGQAGQEPTDVAPNAADKLTAERLGQRLGRLALKLKA